MRPSIAVCLLGLAACGERTVLLASELPDDIAWVGVLFPEDPLAAGSALAPVMAGRVELSVVVPEAIREVRLVAFGAQDLDRYGPPDSAELQSKRLLAAASGHAAMRPRFSARGSIDDLSNLAPEVSIEPISAEWRPPCTDLALDEEKFVHLPCLANPCAARMSQTECEVVLDAPGCGQRLEGRVGKDGTLAFSNQTVMKECSSSGGSPIVEMICDGPRVTSDVCPISLLPPAWEAPRVEVTGVDLSPGVFERGGGLRSEHLLDLVRDGSRLITLSAGDASFLERECATDASLVFVELENMQLIGERDAPTCPHALAFDARDRALFVAHGMGRTSIAQLNADGEPVRSVEFPEEVQPPTWYPIRMFFEPSSRALVVAFVPPSRLEGEEPRPDWRVLVVDGDTLIPRENALEVPRLTRTMFQGGLSEVVIPHGDTTISVLNTESARLGVGLAIGALCGPAGQFHSGLFDANRSRFLLASRANQNHGVTQLEADGSRCRTAFPLESVRDPASLAWWPPNPNLVVTALDGVDQATPTEDSVLAFYDADLRRFLLGEQPIGRGRARNIQPDGQGGVVMNLTAESRIVRVRPVP